MTSRERLLVRLVVVCVTLVSIEGDAAAARQTRQGAGVVLETRFTERWLNGREKARFKPYASGVFAVRIDSVATSADRTYVLHAALYDALYVMESGIRRSNDRARVTIDADGRVRAIELDLQPLRQVPGINAAAAARIARDWWFGSEHFGLPESMLWDAAPSFRPARLRAGERWTDTLRFEAERDGNRQAMRGVRVSTLLRDTVVDGRSVWLVRDSAALRLDERRLEHEESLDTVVTDERVIEGMVTGQRLHDPASAVPVWRDDTARLAGEITLRYPDGRSFRTPTRYESLWRQDRYDDSAYAAVRTQRTRERRAQFRLGGTSSRSSLEGRLRAGDVALRDSLIVAWRATENPAEWVRLGWLLRSFRPRDGSEDIRQALLVIALQLGDTAAVVREAFQAFTPDARLDTGVVRFLQPFLSDPGLGLAFGLVRDVGYASLRGVLLRWPPAVYGATSPFSCTPAACQMLASFADTASEPRLRDIGLLARFAMDPGRWVDEVTRRANAGSAVLRSALPLIQGVGAPWDWASRRPIPNPGGSWREWLEWADGRNPAFPTESPADDRPRFEDSHRLAIDFQETLTRRSIKSELQAALDEATEDSARLVIGTILLGLDAHKPEPDDVAPRLLTGTSAARRLAEREVLAVMRSASPADSATEVDLIDRALGIAIDGAAPFPLFEPAARPQPRPDRDIYVITDSLPPAVRERWAGRVQQITSAESRGLDPRSAHAVMNVGWVRAIGLLAEVTVSSNNWSARSPEQAPSSFGVSTTYYLLRTESGWTIVGTRGLRAH